MNFPVLLLFVILTAVFPSPARNDNGTAAVPAVNAAQIYGQQCASCHGKDGRAKTLKGKIKRARNLTDGEWQEKVSDERVFNSIMNGKGKMPAYSKKLSQEQIEALRGLSNSLAFAKCVRSPV